MESQSQTTTVSAPARTVARCPFHDGPLTLDLLLASFGPDEAEAMDRALDLRSAVVARTDARTCLQLALDLRRVLDGRHYLAFYRFRLWLQRVILIQIRAHRGEPWSTLALPLNSARLDEIENQARAAYAAAPDAAYADWVQIRFVFRSAQPPVHA